MLMLHSLHHSVLLLFEDHSRRDNFSAVQTAAITRGENEDLIPD